MISLPKDFIDRIEAGPLGQTPMLASLDSESPISIRLNPRKKSAQFENEEVVSWCSDGRYLRERPSFTLDPLFHAGTYYPQEAGSMYIDAIVRSIELPENPVLLDLCAAPGGKSTLLASYLDNRGMLISNEIIRSRAYILAETLTKWGYSNTFVSNNAPADFEKLHSYFDFILVDAPCSGEGMFRKDPNARLEWSLESAAHCAVRQADILASVWPSLKEDGYLLYSTCTFNPAENEECIAAFLEEHEAEIVPIPFFEGLIPDVNKFGYHFIPGIAKSEGFYAVLLQKKEFSGPNKRKSGRIPTVSSSEIPLKIDADFPHVYFKNEENIFATSAFCIQHYDEISNVLHWMKRGTLIAIEQRKGWQLEIELALNFSLYPDIPTIELSRQEALQYLHGDTFHLEGKPGYTLLSYEGQQIGIIKHLGNRFNNSHPKEWRIRMNIPRN
jgi:16S rRNA C967 or C1407 C5-methylase (RsmB/RsmF family)/NOL1/NOP2/fmu family ribosome biogenesis protein